MSDHLLVQLILSLHRKMDRVEKAIYTMSDSIGNELADATVAVTNTVGVEQSAIVAFKALSQKLADALTAASNAGATADQLKAFATLDQQLTASSAALATAIATNPGTGTSTVSGGTGTSTVSGGTGTMGASSVPGAAATAGVGSSPPASPTT